MSELEGEITMSAATALAPAPGSALAALRKDQGADALAQLGDASTCDAFLADDDACAFLAVACERAPRTRLRVRLEMRAGGGLEALAALVKAAPPRPGALRLAAALAGDAAGARALARRGARHAATRALDDGRTSDAAASLLAAVVSASESDDDDDDEGLVAYGSAVFRRTLRGRQRSHSDVGFCTWPSAPVLASLAPREIPAGASVLELGAGTGLAGLVFASRALCGAVTLSDRKGACLANLREAVAVNDFGACDVSVERVDFCAPPASITESYDAVIAADCVYSPETATALVKTVRTALKPGGLALVVCAETRVRFGSELVESAFTEAGFDGHVETITPDAALPLLKEAAGYAEGMSFDVHRWRLK